MASADDKAKAGLSLQHKDGVTITWANQSVTFRRRNKKIPARSPRKFAARPARK